MYDSAQYTIPDGLEHSIASQINGTGVNKKDISTQKPFMVAILIIQADQNNAGNVRIYGPGNANGVGNAAATAGGTVLVNLGSVVFGNLQGNNSCNLHEMYVQGTAGDKLNLSWQIR